MKKKISLEDYEKSFKKEMQKNPSWFSKNLTGFHETNLTGLQLIEILLIFLLVSQIGALGSKTLFKSFKLDLGTQGLISSLLMYGGSMLVILIAMGGFDHYHFSLKTIYMPFKNWLSYFAHSIRTRWLFIISCVFIAWCLVTMSMTVFGFILDGSLHSSQSGQETLKMIKSNPYILIAVVLVQPIAEELIYRYLIPYGFYNLLSTKSDTFLFLEGSTWNKIMLYISFIFGVYCFANAHGNVYGGTIMGYLTFGLFMQFLQNKSNSLVLPASVHMGFNLFQAFLVLA